MEKSDIEAHNELEKQLIEAQAGRLTGEAFMSGLIDAQIFLPVRDDKAEIGGFQQDTRAMPLVLEAEEGIQAVAIFTSPERAKPVLESYPDYQGGILVTVRWLLERTGTGIGISLNPGNELGVDFEPGELHQFAAAEAGTTGDGPAIN